MSCLSRHFFLSMEDDKAEILFLLAVHQIYHIFHKQMLGTVTIQNKGFKDTHFVHVHPVVIKLR